MASPNATHHTSGGSRIAERLLSLRAADIARALVLYVVFDGFSHGLFDVRLASFVSMTLLATLLALVLACVDGRARRVWGPHGRRVVGYTLLVFVSYVTLSALVGGGGLEFGFIKNLLLFAAIVALLDDRRHMAALLWAAGAAGLVQAGLGLGQLISERGMPAGGVTGVLPNHVQYAMYLTLSALALLPFVVRARGVGRAALLAGEAFMFSMIVLSLARGVLVAALASVVVWMMLALRSRRARALAGAGVLAAGALALGLSRRLGTLLAIPAALGDPARLDVLLSGRLPLVLAAWNMWLAHPILGVGYGRFPHVWAQYVPEGIGIPGVLRLELAAHSTYLQIAGETGAVGLALYVSLIGGGMVYAWRSRADALRRGDHMAAMMAASVLACLMAIAMHGTLDNTGWHDRVFYILLAAAVAFPAAVQQPSEGAGGIA